MARCVYVHVPFCLKKCAYCDFLSVPYDEPFAGRYVAALLREIEVRRPEAPVSTVYIGGGTPTALAPGLIEKVFSAIFKLAPPSPDAEVTVEANPGTVDGDKIRRLAALGVNRVSVGVQSFDDGELAALGRIHSAREAEEAAKAVLDALPGGNFSLDLMYGIPGQTPSGWRRTLERAVALGPAHISAYELTPERCTPLFDALQSGALSLPGEDAVADMFLMADEKLASLGYGHYEISNYALPGRECLHNMNYWRRGEYLGLGAGAHSFVGERRMRNTKDIGRYIEALEGGSSATEEDVAVSPSDALRERIFLGLRLGEGLAVGPFYGAHGLDLLEAAWGLTEEGFMEEESGRLALTARGMLLSNRVIAEFLDRLGL